MRPASTRMAPHSFHQAVSEKGLIYLPPASLSCLRTAFRWSSRYLSISRSVVQMTFFEFSPSARPGQSKRSGMGAAPRFCCRPQVWSKVFGLILSSSSWLYRLPIKPSASWSARRVDCLRRTHNRYRWGFRPNSPVYNCFFLRYATSWTSSGSNRCGMRFWGRNRNIW